MLHLCLTSFIKCMKAFNIHTHTQKMNMWVISTLFESRLWIKELFEQRHSFTPVIPLTVQEYCPPPLTVLLWWRSTFMEKERRREGSHPVSVDTFPAEASLKQLQLIYGAMTAWLSHYGASISFLFPVTHTLTVGSLVSTDRHDGRTQHRHNFSFCWFSGFQ